MDIKDQILEIQKLINLNKLSKANLNCEKLIKKFPKNSYFYNLNGLILQKKGNIRKSINYFQKATILQKDNYAAMNNLANSHKSLFEYELAENLYVKIIKEDPKNIKALNNYANLKKEFNKYNDAKNLLLEALKIDPQNKDILSNMASCCQGIGEIEQAKKYALKVESLQPKDTFNHRLLSSMIKYEKEHDHLKKMKKLLLIEDFKNFSSQEKQDLYFALGKAHEDFGDFENSYKFLSKANSLVNQNNNFEILNTIKLFDNIIKLFNEIKLESSQKLVSQRQIIFICGMPRSGTTLVEQIIASHSKVNGAGELQYLTKVIEENFLIDLKFDKQKIKEELSREQNVILDRYLKLLDFHNFNSDIITDKAPQNFIWIGFIKYFFPNSKIIHCSRNPKDNCLSLYKNYFSSKSMSWTYDQINIANYYKLYEKIMRFWNNKFKNSIFDAKYENIVNSPELEVRKMLSFCNLNWEENCLNFYKNKKTPVQTVSVSQANKPIYKSSVDSYQGYSEYLSDMFDILDTKK